MVGLCFASLAQKFLATLPSTVRMAAPLRTASADFYAVVCNCPTWRRPGGRH